jgi:hypothetical protein
MKRVLVTFVLDAETVELLRQIAEAEYDNNKSMTVRRIVKDAAKERGITVEPKEQETA